MKPIDQTIFGLPLGNCLQACLASILELPLETVPNFNEEGEMWFPRCCEWAMRHGFSVIDIDVKGLDEWPWGCHGYWIASGPADRGILHCCVYDGSELAHDPHPSRSGLHEIHHIMLVVAPDPAGLYKE